MGTHSTSYLIGLFVGIFVGLLLVGILFKWVKKDRRGKCNYDERQMAIRGVGYKYAFFTGLIGEVAIMCVHDITDKYVSTSVLIFAVVIISIAVYAIYCIGKNGYVALNENPKRETVLFIVIGAINTVSAITSFMEELPVWTESFPSGVNSAGCAILMWVVAIGIWVRMGIDKKEVED